MKDNKGLKGEKVSRNEQVKTTNTETNRSYKSPTQEELLEIWTKQETASQPLDILGNAKLYGSKGMIDNQFVYDVAFFKGDNVQMSSILSSISQQAKGVGATSVRINGNAVVNSNLNEFFIKIHQNGGEFMGWKIIGGGSTGSNISLTKDFK